uniref:extensin-like n=1 Tax=Macaca mulatta TaxID=9544 RepID=UPI0010A2276D|nr:extensin-like [Macaca mulatta]
MQQRLSAAVFSPPSSPLPIVFFPSQDLILHRLLPPPSPHLLLAVASSCRAFLSPHPLLPSSSPHRVLSPPSPRTVFSLHRLLQAPSPQPFPAPRPHRFLPLKPFSSPETVFFPCPPTFSQQPLSGAVFFPLSSLPLPILFITSVLFSTVFFPSPPFSAHFRLPTFSQQRLPAALFSPRTLFSPLPLPTVFVFSPTPFSALSHCLSLRSPPRMRAPVSLRPVCLCAQVDP